MTAEVKKELLSPRETAKMLSISERTLWALSHEKRMLPYVKIGRLTRYRVVDLDNWIDDRTEGDRP